MFSPSTVQLGWGCVSKQDSLAIQFAQTLFLTIDDFIFVQFKYIGKKGVNIFVAYIDVF